MPKSRKSVAREHSCYYTDSPLWESLPSELNDRILAFLLQKCVHQLIRGSGFTTASMVRYTRQHKDAVRMRFVSRAFAEKLRLLVLISSLPTRMDHVSVFTEGLLRLAWEVCDEDQRARYGAAHLSRTCEDEDADYSAFLHGVVKRAWHQAPPHPVIYIGTYRAAMNRTYHRLVHETKALRYVQGMQKERIVSFLAKVVYIEAVSNARQTTLFDLTHKQVENYTRVALSDTRWK